VKRELHNKHVLERGKSGVPGGRPSPKKKRRTSSKSSNRDWDGLLLNRAASNTEKANSEKDRRRRKKLQNASSQALTAEPSEAEGGQKRTEAEEGRGFMTTRGGKRDDKNSKERTGSS